MTADLTGVASVGGGPRRDHPSATGVDGASLYDPDKVWRCDSCGQLYRYDQNGTRVNLKEPTASA